MQKKLATLFLTLTASNAMAHTSYPHPQLPTSEAVQEAIAQFAAVDGAISNLVAIADGKTENGGKGDDVYENDLLARNVLLIMSRKTESTLNKLDELDQAIADSNFTDALLLQKEACRSLDSIKNDNVGARAAADAINVGALDSSLADFDLIDETVVDTKSSVRCP